VLLFNDRFDNFPIGSNLWLINMQFQGIHKFMPLWVFIGNGHLLQVDDTGWNEKCTRHRHNSLFKFSIFSFTNQNKSKIWFSSLCITYNTVHVRYFRYTYENLTFSKLICFEYRYVTNCVVHFLKESAYRKNIFTLIQILKQYVINIISEKKNNCII
jgi:hypothetical protein